MLTHGSKSPGDSGVRRACRLARSLGIGVPPKGWGSGSQELCLVRFQEVPGEWPIQRSHSLCLALCVPSTCLFTRVWCPTLYDPWLNRFVLSSVGSFREVISSDEIKSLYSHAVGTTGKTTRACDCRQKRGRSLGTKHSSCGKVTLPE